MVSGGREEGREVRSSRPSVRQSVRSFVCPLMESIFCRRRRRIRGGRGGGRGGGGLKTKNLQVRERARVHIRTRILFFLATFFS